MRVAKGINKLPREPSNELGQQQHDGGEQRVLSGRIVDIGQTGQIGDKRRRGNAACQIVSLWAIHRRQRQNACPGRPPLRP